MKNVAGENPNDDLNGRLLYTTRFVCDLDLENKLILDIGCGFGWFEVNSLKRNCKNIVGMELTYDDLVTPIRSVKEEHVFFLSGSAVSLPFETNTFDSVVSWDVIEHLDKKMEGPMFHEVYRVLKPGGVFYLSTPNSHFFSKLLDPAWWLVGHRHYSVEQIMNYASGFTAVKMEVKGRWWELLSILNLYFSKWVFRRKPFLNDFFNKHNNRDFRKKGFAGLYIKLKK